MKNVKPNRISNGLLVLLFALVAFPVAAQDSGMAYIPNANKPGGSWVKFTDGQSYKKVLSPAAYGGAITGSIDALATNPSGNQVALKYTAGVSAAAVGSAVGKFASKVVAPLAVGVALYDLGKELGYIFDNSGSELVVTKVNGTVVTGSVSCSTFTGISQYAYLQGGHTYGSFPYGAAPAGWVFVSNCTTGWGDAYRRSVGSQYFPQVHRTPILGNTLPENQSTVQGFADAVSAKTSWPDTSAITRTLQQAQQDYDIFLDYNPVTVSGPASTPGKTSTTTSSTGTTTTSTTTHNHTYEGANVTTSNVTVTNVTNNAGDTTTTTTTETPVKQEPTPDQCEKNPDSIGCTEFGTPEAQQLTQKSIAVQLTPVVFASSATCPANVNASFSVMGRSFSPSFSYAPICTAATDYIRPVMLLLALAGSAFIFVGGLKSGS